MKWTATARPRSAAPPPPYPAKAVPMSFLMARRRFLLQALIALAIPGGAIGVGIYQLVRRLRQRHRERTISLQQNENP